MIYFPVLVGQWVGLLQQGVGHLMRESRAHFMNSMGCISWLGSGNSKHAARRAHRWGKEADYCVGTGRRCRFERTRLLTPERSGV